MQTIVLDKTPSLAGLYAKAVASSRGRRGGPLPDITVRQRGVQVDADRLAAYDQVCGFPIGTHLPSTYLHVLTFPLQVALFTDQTFPYPMTGSVHLANTITSHRPVRADEPLELTVRAANPRPHHRGAQVDLIGEARVEGELVWEGCSTYLYRGQGAEGALPERVPDPQPLDGAGVVWSLPGDLGRRYAGVSGDVNPIHLYPLTAKAMGFPRAIAHGMWSKARMLAAIENRLPSAYRITVEFKKPLLIPSKVRFRAVEDDAAGWKMDLTDARKGTVHAVAAAGPIS